MTRLTIILSLFTLIACTNRTEPNVTHNPTPEILEENNNGIEINSTSKRYNQDIIEKLFSEAIDKDQELKVLVKEIDQIHNFKDDSLNEYNKYQQNNDAYWSTVDRYVGQIKDSTLKREMNSTFDILKKNYLKKISPHKKAIEELELHANMLKDYDILLKLIVSEKMISNYQRNELPDIKTINYVVNKYDTLIHDINEYMELN